MATVKITPDEFYDIVNAFLLDKMVDGDDMLTGNVKFEKMVKKMKLSGFESLFLRNFMLTDPIVRSKYKVIKKSFRDSTVYSGINIRGDSLKDTINPVDSTLSGKIKKILKTVKEQKIKNHGIPVNEETVDRIIDKILKED